MSWDSGQVTVPVFSTKLGTSWEDVSEIGADHPFSSAGVQLAAVSTDNTSDLSGQIGAQEIKLTYIDGAGAVQTEAVPMNGTTPVQTAALDIRAILHSEVSKVGSAGKPAGDLTLSQGGNDWMFNPAGEMQFAAGKYMVPTGRVAQIGDLKLNSSVSSGIEVRLLADIDRSTEALREGVFQELERKRLSRFTVWRPVPGISFPPGAQIKIQAILGSGSADLYGSMNLNLS